MKIFKLFVAWVTAIIAPILLAEVAATNSVDWLVKMSLVTLYGYFLLVFFGGILKLSLGMKLDEIVWSVGAVNLLACGWGFELPFIMGSFLGIAIAYGLLRLTRNMHRMEPLPATAH